MRDRADQLGRDGLVRTFVLVSAWGLVVICSGLLWDVAKHAREPLLAAHEEVLTLTNPAHALMGLGVLLVAVGVGGALGGRRSKAEAVQAAAGSLAAVVLITGVAGLIGGGGSGVGPTQALAEPDAGADELAADPDGHHPAVQQNPAQRKLVADVRKSLERYVDVDDGMAAGYQFNPKSTNPVRHYANPRYEEDGTILDPKRPEGLVYLWKPDGSKVLAGAIFKAPAGVNPPNPGGVKWHTHNPKCEHHDESCRAIHVLHVWTPEWVVDPFADNLGKAAGPAQVRELREELTGDPRAKKSKRGR